MGEVKLMSTGQPSTLGNWYKMCAAYFGKDSSPTLFIKEKMDQQGEDQPVIADEGQLLSVLGKMFVEERNGQE